MKRISWLLFFLTNLSFAQSIFGEYQNCTSSEEIIKDSYIHLVKFEEDSRGIQIMIPPMVFSMVLKFDGKSHQTIERLSRRSFRYQASPTLNSFDVFFESEYFAKLLGLEQNFVINGDGHSLYFTFEGMNLTCTRKMSKKHRRHYRSFARRGVPRQVLKKALRAYQFFKLELKNKRYISIADYSQSSTQKRFYLLDLKKRKVHREYVSHGSGKRNGTYYGDPDHDGMLDRCFHEDGSKTNMTRIGAMITAHTYRSMQKFPIINSRNRHNGLKLVGLEDSNRDVFPAGVVMHEAYYNNTAGEIQGRSFGCPAFPHKKGKLIINKIKNGSLFYSYAPQCLK